MVSGGTPLPQIEYFITYRNHYQGAHCDEIAEICQQICDFATTWRAP